MEKIHVNKGHILQHKGEKNSKLFVVESGLLRSFLVDRNGREHTFIFASQGWIMAESIPPAQPCSLFIEAIEDSIVIQKEKDGKIEDMKKIFNRLQTLQNRVLMMMSSSAIERYEYFINTYPDIACRIPQKMIASYLGITPETLSALKNKAVYP
ncbi:MAG: Crp/Fnr family transcriptional regulator [Bacteroidota bacterium]